MTGFYVVRTCYRTIRRFIKRLQGSYEIYHLIQHFGPDYAERKSRAMSLFQAGEIALESILAEISLLEIQYERLIIKLVEDCVQHPSEARSRIRSFTPYLYGSAYVFYKDREDLVIENEITPLPFIWEETYGTLIPDRYITQIDSIKNRISVIRSCKKGMVRIKAVQVAQKIIEQHQTPHQCN